jgi:hypothetical protein
VDDGALALALWALGMAALALVIYRIALRVNDGPWMTRQGRKWEEGRMRAHDDEREG